MILILAFQNKRKWFKICNKQTVVEKCISAFPSAKGLIGNNWGKPGQYNKKVPPWDIFVATPSLEK